jgi:DNA invertase Pin-like site-specific DNA recombinase
MVWKLDRLGRSLKHLIETVTGLSERGVGFLCLQEAIDQMTSAGKLVFHVFGALAEFKRASVRHTEAIWSEAPDTAWPGLDSGPFYTFVTLDP